MTQTLSTDTAAITAHIDLNALRHNLALARQAAPDSKVMAVVKADAYGHGAIPVANALSDADAFGVARISEALSLRQAGIHHSIVVLSMNCGPQQLRLCSEQQLDIVLHSTEGLQQLLDTNLSSPINVWLKIDSGMHRLGIAPEQVQDSFSKLKHCSCVANIYLMSHFSSADETGVAITTEQTDRFLSAGKDIKAPYCLANSAAILAWPDTHCDWVRPGIMLYGSDPLDISNTLSQQLKPVMELSAPLIALRTVRTGEYVGYGRTWCAARDSLIGTVAIGYADGYPRHAKNATPVLVNGVRVPLAGRVSMDMITIDLTDHPSFSIGDRVVLWGKQLNINEIASMSDTIAYELLTGVGKRVNFVYT